MLNVGKLYQIKKHFWMVYPTKDIVAAAAPDADTAVPLNAGVTKIPDPIIRWPPICVTKMCMELAIFARYTVRHAPILKQAN